MRAGRCLASFAGYTLVAIELVAALPAAAQTVPAGTDTMIPIATSSLGVPVGGFLVFPDLHATLGYDDNIFLRKTNIVGDVTSVLRANIAANSNWNRHELDLSGYVIDTRYLKYGDQNNDQYAVQGNGRLDIYHDLNFSGRLSYGHLVEQRGTPGNDLLEGSPVAYQLITGSGAITKSFNRVSIVASGRLRRYRYNQVELPSGVVLEQRYRNHTARNISGQINYAYSAITTMYVVADFSHVGYHPPADVIDRTNSGFSVLGGAQFEITRLLHGSLGVGYISQHFRDPRQTSFSGLDYSADVTYEPTRLTKLVLSANRSLNDSANQGVGAVLTSSVSLNVTHELLRKLILGARLDYSSDKYSNSEQTRDRFTSTFSAERRFNDYLRGTLSYSHRSRISSGGFNYTENLISAGLAVFR